MKHTITVRGQLELAIVSAVAAYLLMGTDHGQARAEISVALCTSIAVIVS